VTDIRATQVSIEQFATGTPAVQVTSVSLEMWASVQATSGTSMVATLVATEMWGSVAIVPVAAGGPMVTMIG
jgi:hypothetical protein